MEDFTIDIIEQPSATIVRLKGNAGIAATDRL